ncbi:MAG: DinB family protein [Granulicella sp.]
MPQETPRNVVVGRPEADEAVPFFFNYINQVEGDDILTALDRQLPEALTFFGRYTEETSLQPYAPGKWSLRQTLGHITDVERILTFRALWLARGIPSPLPSFDQDHAVIAAESDGVTWAAHREEFERVRLASLSLFRNLPADAWMRTGEVSGHSISVRALAFIAAGHCAHHLRILREI